MTQMQIRGSTQILSGSITWDRMASGAIVPTTSLTDGSLFIKSDGSVSMAANLSLGSSNRIINLAAPNAGSDAATKSYVDAIAFGFHFRGARLLAASNVTLSGLSAIDGVTPSAGDRVLLVAQTTDSQNGLWQVASGSWTRPSDYAAASSQTEGIYVFLDPDGTTYGNTKWRCTNTGTITVDTTSTTWTQDANTTYSNGSGLSLTGTVFAVKNGNGISFDGSSNVVAVADSTRLGTVSASGIGILDGTSGQIIVAASSNKAAWATMSGDVTISNTGVTTISSSFVKYAGFISNEIPTGSINGSNTSFTLANTPNPAGNVQLFQNGLLAQQGAGKDYTISGTTITMGTAPPTGDILIAFYEK